MTYQHMATVYDYLMKNAPYDHWVSFAENIFKKYGRDIKEVIDLGCGTGEISLRLAEKGYNLYGVDNSSDMLSYAQQKAYEKNIPIQWFHQDIRYLDGFHNLDAAISFCDVINYITSENDLKKTFNRVYHLLKDDGIFLFDVHSLQYVQNSMINHTFTEVTDEISYIWECLQGEDLGEMYHQMTFFCLNGDKYDRFDEYHHQKTYPILFYEKLLKEIGFEKVNIYADFSLEKTDSFDEAERIFFLAIKRSR